MSIIMNYDETRCEWSFHIAMLHYLWNEIISSIKLEIVACLLAEFSTEILTLQSIVKMRHIEFMRPFLKHHE